MTVAHDAWAVGVRQAARFSWVNPRSRDFSSEDRIIRSRILQGEVQSCQAKRLAQGEPDYPRISWRRSLSRFATEEPS